MSNIKSNRTISLIALLSIIISVGSLLFVSTPCNIAEGQTICDIGDNETITTSLTIENSLIVGATPSAGVLNDILVSQGADKSPEWVNGLIPTIYNKTSNQTNNTTTLVADTELQFPTTANTDYWIEGLLIVNTTVTEDWKLIVSEPSGTVVDGLVNDNTSWVDINEIAASAISVPSTGELAYNFWMFVDGGSVAGTFALQWAQNSAGAGPTSMNEGSYLKVYELP